jgi:DNA polymerase V
MQLNILEDPELQVKRYTLDHVVDDIRKKYGFSSLVKASSLTKGATAIKRSKLVGVHNGGNAYE